MTKQVILRELSSGKDYEISIPCVIGRGKEVGLSCSDLSISHRHALIEEIDGRIWIEDLESANGVFVNHQRIKEKTPMEPGDSIQLGQTTFVVNKAQEDLAEQTLVVQSLYPEAEWVLDHQRLQLIYKMTTELSENQDLIALERRIVSRFKGIFNQDRAYIALFREDGSL